MSEHSCLIIGATGGIGKAAARAMARMGFSLYIHGRNRDKLGALSGELRSLGSPQVNAILQNLEQRKHIDELIKKVRPHKELIDVLIVAYGPMSRRSMAEADSEHIERMFDMNMLLPARLLSLLAPAMAENRWGRIILFGNTSGDDNRPYQTIAHYGAAKYGLMSLVRSASREFSEYGVTVNAILPGYVRTEYYKREDMDNLKKQGKLLEPETISDIIKFLVSDSSCAVNGSILNSGAGREW